MNDPSDITDSIYYTPESTVIFPWALNQPPPMPFNSEIFLERRDTPEEGCFNFSYIKRLLRKLFTPRENRNDYYAFFVD